MSECNCDCGHESNDSGFILGIVIGAVIGAAVAIYIYKNNKTDVLSDLKEKLENYFRQFTHPKNHSPKPRSKKISVVLPKKVVDSIKSVKPVISKSKKMFIKAGK